ncbi:hypothetical protein DFP72DRAFT_858132 [Ephemerocybe angulata]|uniref:Uncharacterized protein n=1 Tax=Ephemerocybe angulata TaxID=980116 RepID=A0A8H6HCL9_9AGAR|nr:hypothetical protein DFP72DRAFT_858132 [Tulosesus angulatus]
MHLLCSPYQLLDILKWKRANAVDSSVASNIRAAVKWYFHGAGHPYIDSRMVGLCTEEELEAEKTDPTLHARTFLKQVSGVGCLPSGNTIEPETDLIPPQPNSCVYSMDIYVNKPLIETLKDANVPLGEDTLFDWVMHSGICQFGGSQEQFNGS